MASLDLTAADAILKQLYDYGRVNELAYDDFPALAMMPKYEKFGGRNRVIPVRYSRPQGVSALFATAQSGAVASKFTDFLITVVANYGVATVDGKTAESAASDKHSFVNAMTTEIDGVIQEVARDASRNLFRSSTGSIGQVGSVSTVTVTLKAIQDVHNFEVGQEIQATTNETALLDSGNACTITAVDRTTGELTTDSNWGSQISGIAADDYLLKKGDLGLKMSGMSSWLPSTPPSAGESFFGVDRSVDSRLYGNYYDGSSEASIEDALIEGQSLGAVIGGRPDCCFLNNKNYRELVKALGSKVEYMQQVPVGSKAGNKAAIGFRGMLIEGDSGVIEVYPDRDVPVNEAFILEKKSWEINSIGQMPKILMLDGLRIQRQASSDGYEVRVGYYSQIACDFPGANTRVGLPTT